jgi:hypothetical protein
MLRRVLCGAAVVALVLVAVFAPSAPAAESSLRPGGAILLRGTHGYRLFALFGAQKGEGEMQLFVLRRSESAIYEAEGEVVGNRIDVDLGALGRIDLERRATGKTETIRACGRTEREPGYDFVGTIEFHGEEGFTEVTATRAEMDWKPLVSGVCEFFGEGEEFGPGTPGVRIIARQRRGPTLQLNQNHRGAGVVYRAELEEREGAVTVSRFVGGRLGAGALSFTPSLGSATFTGTGRFEGKATYVEAVPPRGTHPGEGAWRGDLTVDFPGAAGVPLAGPGFTAGIIHAHRTESHQ